jgi:predicted PurR-regulated permease PerM
VADDVRPRSAPIRSWRAGLTPESAALLVGAVVTAFVVRNAFVAAHRTIGWVVACAIVALLIDPLVDFVDRLLPRVLSVVVVLLAVLAAVGGITVGLAHDVLESIDELKTAAPEAAAELEAKHDWAADIGVADRVQAFVDDLDQQIRHEAVSQAAETVPTYVVTGILMLFLLAFGRRYFDALVRQFPQARQPAIRDVVTSAALRGRHYLLVTIGLSIVNGLVVGLVCWGLDVPAPVSLGIAVGLFTILPLIGVVVGGVPALLLAFGLGSWPTGAMVAVTLLVLQLFEAGVVRPFVDARTVRLGPTIPIVVGLLGFDLYGVGGALYGIALAVLVLAALDGVGRLRGDDLELVSE